MDLYHSTTESAVLVVEDDAAVRNFLSLAIKTLGFRASECCDVPSAERILQHASPWLILTDCNLPHRSGIDLIRWSQRERSELPIVGMSAEHFKGIQMLEAGASDFIEKPIDLCQLRSLLDRHQPPPKAA